MIKFHDIKNKNLFDLCPPGVNVKEWNRFRSNYKRAENLEILDAPPQIDIELNAGCNMKCPFCLHGYKNIKNNLMHTNAYKKIIDEAVEFGVRGLKLNYINEPMLRKDLEDCIEYAKKAGILNVYMVTNGTLLKESRYDRLLESGITKVFVSIDAVTEETYNKQRLSGKYSLVVNNLMGFIKRRDEKGLQFPLVRVSFLRNSINQHEEKEFDNNWRNIVDIITYQKMNDLPDLNTGITIEESNGNGDGCSFPFKQMVVDNEGDILPCCKMGGKKLVLGNIKDTTLRGAWNSRKMKELRYIHKNNKWRENSVCRRCILNK